MKKRLKINFTDFWSDFKKENNLFVTLLSFHYEVEISGTPDVLIYSCYGFDYISYNCHKIFYTAENVRPNYLECDFSLTFDYDTYNNRNFRLPLYRWNGDLDHLCNPKNIDKIVAEKKKFCCILVSNPNGKERNLFFEKLSKYKKVDSGGRFKNNVGKPVVDKMDFINEYKFTLSFENSNFPGYTTEKIIEPMFANSIPIYWGNPKIENDFNPKSFINVHQYNSFDKAIEQVIAVDKNPEVYKEYLMQPYFHNNTLPGNLQHAFIADKLFSVIESFNGDMLNKRNRMKLYSYVNKQKRRFLSRLLKKQHWYC